MSETVKLQAGAGHTLDAYVARPAGTPLAGLVIVQEIFGVNQHIRSVADRYAAEGFLAIAPALFDRYERNLELGYGEPDLAKAYLLHPQLDADNALKDVAAALAYARKQTGKPALVLGYCWGGTIAWLSATRLDPSAAVGYYAGQIAKYAEEVPRAPVMLHFGREDTHIPEKDVSKVAEAHPEVQIYWYDAGHAFNNDMRASYNAQASAQAFERSLKFLKQHAGE